MLKKLAKRLLKKSIKIQDNTDGFKKIEIGKYQLVAKLDHKLDLYLKEFPEYSQNFPRIANIILKDRPNDKLVDIGANIGDTIALLRKHEVKNHIFCIEGDNDYYSLLQENANQFTEVTLLKYYLTDQESNKGYTVDSHNGTARIVETEVSTIQTPIITLDKLSKKVDFGAVKIIKIDTDGFDFKIIRGGLETIDKLKPILFIEYDCVLSMKQEENPLNGLSTLQKLGYNQIIYFDNYGRIISTTTLNDDFQIKILDIYITNGLGAFPYYDILIFHKNDDQVYNKIISQEIEYWHSQSNTAK